MFYRAIQKQPPDVLCEKRCRWKFRKIHSETPVPESLFEAAIVGVLWEKVFSDISQNSQENTCARVSLPATLLKKDSGTGIFQWILRNSKEYDCYRKPLDDCFWLFHRHPRQKHIQDCRKHLKWRVPQQCLSPKNLNYCYKALHFSCLWG